MEQEFVYNLSKELVYTPYKKGEFDKTASIVFTAPTMDSFDEVSDFEQLFMGSIVTAGNLFKRGEEEVISEQEKSALQELKDNTPKPDEIRMLISLSQEVKIKDLFRAFRKLAKKTAKLDEKTKLKDSHIDKLSKDDALGMMCGYASFFTFPSLLAGE